MSRWTIAAIGALGLALATLPFVPGIGGNGEDEIVSDQSEGESTKVAAPAGCDANAKPANLDFVLKDMEGKDVKLADYKGKVVLLNFWATWCGPCKIEIPGFVELQEKYRDQGVVFLGFSVDDSPDKLKTYASDHNMNYPVLVGDGHEEVQEAFGPIYGIPVTVVINREGMICRKHTGIAPKNKFEEEIKALL